MNLVSVMGRERPNRRGLGLLGQYHHAVVHHAATAQVTATDIQREVANRGYVLQTAVVHHAPVVAPTVVTVTKSQAIKIAVDGGIKQLGLPRSSTHLYRCPTGTCALSKTYYDLLISWSVNYANGLLSGKYAVPTWAKDMMHSGALRGLGGRGHLGGVIQDNPWLISWLGDGFTRFGEHLTAKNVEDAIKEVEKNTRGSLSKDDIPTLVAALTAGGYIQPGQEGIVAAGAEAAATPSWMMPVLLVGGALMVFLLMGRR